MVTDAIHRAAAVTAEHNPRFSLESVANAFVLLDLLSADRAEAILAAYRPVLEAAGFRVGRTLGELAVQPATRAFQQVRATTAPGLRQVPLTTASGPVRCRLRGHDITITQATLTPEGISLRFHGDPQQGDGPGPPVSPDDIISALADLAITDDAGRTYRVPPGHAHAIVSGQCSAPGGTRWTAEGGILAVPAGSGPPDDLPDVRWIEFSTRTGPPVRLNLLSPAAVPVGVTRPPWPNPAECYLAEFTPSFLVAATDDTDAAYEGSLSRCSVSIATLEGSAAFWLWPPVNPQARQLRVTVSTLWEAAWVLLGIPGR